MIKLDEEVKYSATFDRDQIYILVYGETQKEAFENMCIALADKLRER